MNRYSFHTPCHCRTAVRHLGTGVSKRGLFTRRFQASYLRGVHTTAEILN